MIEKIVNEKNYDQKIPINIVKNIVLEDSYFSIDSSDIIFTLARCNNFNKEKVNNIVSKMIVVKGFNKTNLSDMAEALSIMGISKLNVISIDTNSELNNINIIASNKDSELNYIEMHLYTFTKVLLNSEHINFWNNNKYTLYILRGGSYKDLKILFTEINNCKINLARWRVPKSSYVKSF